MSHMTKDKPLTVKQDRFVKEYVKNGGNGSKAARDAGYSSTPGVAGAIGHENLQKPEIKGAINEIALKALTAAELTDDHITAALMRECGLDGKGGPSDQQQGGRVRAVEILAKTRAMLTEKTIVETKALSSLELVKKLATDGCPHMAVGAVKDLCLSPIQTATAIREEFPAIAAMIDDLEPDINAGETVESSQDTIQVIDNMDVNEG